MDRWAGPFLCPPPTPLAVDKLYFDSNLIEGLFFLSVQLTICLALIQVMAWQCADNKPLACSPSPQWVNSMRSPRKLINQNKTKAERTLGLFALSYWQEDPLGGTRTEEFPPVLRIATWICNIIDGKHDFAILCSLPAVQLK